MEELHNKINIQKKLADNMEYSIMLKDQSIENYKSMDKVNQNIIKQKDKEITKAKSSAKGWMIGGISVTVVAVILLIAK